MTGGFLYGKMAGVLVGFEIPIFGISLGLFFASSLKTIIIQGSKFS